MQNTLAPALVVSAFAVSCGSQINPAFSEFQSSNAFDHCDQILQGNLMNTFNQTKSDQSKSALRWFVASMSEDVAYQQYKKQMRSGGSTSGGFHRSNLVEGLFSTDEGWGFGHSDELTESQFKSLFRQFKQQNSQHLVSQNHLTLSILWVCKSATKRLLKRGLGA